MVGVRIINIREIIRFSCLGVGSLIDFPFKNDEALPANFCYILDGHFSRKAQFSRLGMVW